VDRLINKTFEEIKEKENLDEDITLDKFVEKKESREIFEKYLNKTKEKWEKNFEKEIKDLEKAGTFIVYQAQRSVEFMKRNIKILKNPSKLEEYATDMIKGTKSIVEFALLLYKMNKEKGKPTNIQKKILAEKDFVGFTISTLKELNSKVKVEENEYDEIKEYTNALRYEIISIFKNTKHLSQEAIENIEKLKQDLIKDTAELDINKTLEDAIKHAIKFKAATNERIGLLRKQIERMEDFLINDSKKIEEKKDEAIDNMSLEEVLEEIEQASKKGKDIRNTIHNPIELINLFKITHKEEKLKTLNEYITYNWLCRLKEFENREIKLQRIFIELTKREMIELEKRRKKK
jgi:hypothetical protein